MALATAAVALVTARAALATPGVARRGRGRGARHRGNALLRARGDTVEDGAPLGAYGTDKLGLGEGLCLAGLAGLGRLGAIFGWRLGLQHHAKRHAVHLRKASSVE